MAMTDADAVALLFTPGTADDPQAAYAQLRDQCPVARGEMMGSGVAMVNTYDDILWALRHPDYFTSADGMLNLGEQPLIPLEVDPPEHTKYRRMLNPQFVPREIEKLEPEVRRLVNELIDGFVDNGAVDFHNEFSTPLPSGIFLALMGLPMEDLPQFLIWRDNSIRPDVAPDDTEGAELIRKETAHAISDYFRVAIEKCRANPSDTLLSQIVHSEIEGRPLNEAELLGISHLLLLGGLDTVTATLDCMISFLATHPDLRQQLVDDPACVPAAVEELLRYLTPVMLIPRTVKQDVELHGVEMHAGDAVMLVLGAANGDPSEFGDGEVDFARDPNKHLAFGAKNHLCLGAHLARLELRVALEEFHRRIPDYRIPEGVELHFSPGIRQADPLPLEYGPA